MSYIFNQNINENADISLIVLGLNADARYFGLLHILCNQQQLLLTDQIFLCT